VNLRGLENRFFGGVRDARAADVTRREIRPWSPSALSDHNYCLLTSYRKDGTPVSTPVWFGIDAKRMYVRSGGQDWKIKRIQRNPRVLVAPCTARGRPLGDPMEGVARVLDPEAWPRGEAALRAHYGLGRKLYRLVRRRLDVAYIAISAPGESGT
jgi:PPOX class probable F420-dependent enzyme